jgi:hypothetical protein
MMIFRVPGEGEKGRRAIPRRSKVVLDQISSWSIVMTLFN